MINIFLLFDACNITLSNIAYFMFIWTKCLLMPVMWCFARFDTICTKKHPWRSVAFSKVPCYWGVFLLVKLQATACKWYQIAQCIIYSTGICGNDCIMLRVVRRFWKLQDSLIHNALSDAKVKDQGILEKCCHRCSSTLWPWIEQ